MLSFHRLRQKPGFLPALICPFVHDIAMDTAGIPAGSGHTGPVTGVQATPVMTLRCSDIGINCPFEVEGSTGRELMRKMIDHAESAHGIPVLAPEMLLKIQTVIMR